MEMSMHPSAADAAPAPITCDLGFPDWKKHRDRAPVAS